MPLMEDYLDACRLPDHAKSAEELERERIEDDLAHMQFIDHLDWLAPIFNGPCPLGDD